MRHRYQQVIKTDISPPLCSVSTLSFDMKSSENRNIFIHILILLTRFCFVFTASFYCNLFQLILYFIANLGAEEIVQWLLCLLAIELSWVWFLASHKSPEQLPEVIPIYRARINPWELPGVAKTNNKHSKFGNLNYMSSIHIILEALRNLIAVVKIPLFHLWTDEGQRIQSHID